MTSHVGAAHPYLAARPPLALAHRGGAKYPPNRGIENTMTAFANAVSLGYQYLETDVHASSDGVVYAFHDLHLARLTGRELAIVDITSEVVDNARVGGSEPIPRLADVLRAFPDIKFNIDLKSDGAVEPTLKVISDLGAQDRVCLASFDHSRILRVRRLAPWVATSASPWETALLRVGPLRRWRATAGRHGAIAVQVPHRRRGVTIVTRGFVKRVHQAGLQVHVWTIDDPREMAQLLDKGVDGIVTDRIDVLRAVLETRGQWGTHA